jgi:hypothetical protein
VKIDGSALALPDGLSPFSVANWPSVANRQWPLWENLADRQVRHEAPYNRVEMKGLRHWPVAAGK